MCRPKFTAKSLPSQNNFVIFAETDNETTMKTKGFVLKCLITATALCSVLLTSCRENLDLGLGYTITGTIVGDDENGYYLYSDRYPEVAVSYEKGLDKYERAYCSIRFKEENRFFSDRPGEFCLIDNADIEIITPYDVIRPISKTEADERHITDSCSAAPHFLTGGYASRGYFNFSTAISVLNMDDMSHSHIPADLIYDPARQSPDTLRLELCYRPRIPEGKTACRYEYGTTSCDISGLAGLQEWNDSLCIVIEAGDSLTHRIPISRNDFRKPEPLFN